MSSGISIPYHLRQNKAVERALFIYLLRKLNKVTNISDYQYIGFGGPFLEDFKHLHRELKINNMISLEINENVRKRQIFNKPISCVNFLDKATCSSDFIAQHNFDKKTIIWLDYVSFKDIPNQLSDIFSLVSKLSNKDILKITMNANPANLGKPESTSSQSLPTYRYEKIKELLTEDYCPYAIKETDITPKHFPNVIIQSIHRAILKGLNGNNNIKFLPLSNFCYSDGQQMITLTGILIDPEEEYHLINNAKLQEWPYFNSSWEKHNYIDLPALSTKERLFIESYLPEASHEDIINELGYWIGDKERDAKESMKNFVDYYRTTPWFGRVIL